MSGGVVREPGGEAVLGVDLGTSGLKVALVAQDGTVLVEREAGYRVDAPEPGWAETDPADWWTALTEAVAGLAPALATTTVRGIGLAGQMHGLVLCDAAGAPLRPAVLWPDRRAEPDLVRWRGLPAADLARLANPVVAGMYGPVLAWLAAHEPATVARAGSALFAKDVLRARLTGSVGTERSDASASLLWDVVADDWSRSVVSRIGVPDRLLPTVAAPATVVGTTSWLAETVAGGPVDVPVVAGAADTAAALLASGSDGGLQVNLGTGAQVLLPGAAPRPVDDPSTHVYADADGGWYAMSAVQNAGLAVEWARGLLGLTWPELVGIAQQRPSGPRTISFLPFLTGERGGVAQPGSRGAWVGLDPRATREDLARAALEAMAFTVRRALELLPDAPAPDEVVRLTGGGSREPCVQQLLADVLGRAVQRVEVRSASATGAAMLAARGVGLEMAPSRSYGPVLDPAATDQLEAAYRLWSSRVPVADA